MMINCKKKKLENGIHYPSTILKIETKEEIKNMIMKNYVGTEEKINHDDEKHRRRKRANR